MTPLEPSLRAVTRVACGLMTAACAQAAPGSTPLQLDGPGPYYRLTLPVSVYTLAKDRDLADLRLRNAAGQTLPWAWQEEELVTPPTRTRRVPLFAVPIQAAAGPVKAVRLRVNADGSLDWQGRAASPPPQADWIVDTHAATGNLLQLRLSFTAPRQGVFPLRVEASDDLTHWRELVGDAAVLHLTSGAQRLHQNQIDLGGARARYLRLHWLQAEQAPQLQGAEVDSFEQVVPSAPALQWSEAWAPQHCEVRACTWRTPVGLPVDALRVELAEPNTVVSMRILGESPVSESAAGPRRHRHPLQALRHRGREGSTTAEAGGLATRLLADTVVWRLAPVGQPETATPALWMDGSQLSQIRIEADSSVNEWGVQPPRLRIGTRGRSLAFLLRGSGPVSLSWGQSTPDGAAVAPAVLMPVGHVGEMGVARVDPAAVAPSAPSAPSAASSSADAAVQAAGPGRDHTPWLWAALGVGLLLLGSMAASLLKQIKPRP